MLHKGDIVELIGAAKILFEQASFESTVIIEEDQKDGSDVILVKASNDFLVTLVLLQDIVVKKKI
jgi:hypothetical protein